LNPAGTSAVSGHFHNLETQSFSIGVHFFQWRLQHVLVEKFPIGITLDPMPNVIRDLIPKSFPF
jgi:hypothetical protein